jgi:hypothetical protein
MRTFLRLRAPLQPRRSAFPLALIAIIVSSSRYLLTAILSLKPFLLLVLSTRSLASDWPVAGSDGRIGRITRNDRPMIECHLRESLAHCRCTQIRLEPVRIQHGDEGFDGVQWRTRFGGVASDVPSTTGEDGVHCRNAVGRRLHLDVVHRLEKAWSGLEQDINKVQTVTIGNTTPLTSRNDE